MLPTPTTLEEALAENAMLRNRVQRLEELVARLEARLNQNSQNSSKPPSTDPPGVKLPPKKMPSGRKPGGQPGHKGSRRELLPPEKVDKLEHHWPAACEKCGNSLPVRNRSDVGEPQRHQVAEIPAVHAHVTEHQMHSQCCDACGHVTPAELPDGVPAGAFGPRLQAVTALFTGAYRVSKRVAESALSDLFGVKLSLGSVSASEQTMSAALASPVAEARAYVEQQAVVHADETGWREERKRAWLWIAGTPLVTVFLVHIKRGAEAARALLGAFAGILVTDRWAAYNGWSLAKRQLCWAHLLRDFTFISQSKGTSGSVGKALVRLGHKLFRNWYRVRDGTMTRAAFKRSAERLRIDVELLLKQGVGCHAPKVAGMCEEILKVYAALWTFVAVEGVEPTNNFAERNLRAAVLWRKGSFGTHSEAGSRFVERIMTVVATCRLQHRNVFDYLVQASEAHLHRLAPPSLLPTAR
jgi:transposase